MIQNFKMSAKLNGAQNVFSPNNLEKFESERDRLREREHNFSDWARIQAQPIFLRTLMLR